MVCSIIRQRYVLTELCLVTIIVQRVMLLDVPSHIRIMHRRRIYWITCRINLHRIMRHIIRRVPSVLQHTIIRPKRTIQQTIILTNIPSPTLVLHPRTRRPYIMLIPIAQQHTIYLIRLMRVILLNKVYNLPRHQSTLHIRLQLTP